MQKLDISLSGRWHEARRRFARLILPKRNGGKTRRARMAMWWAMAPTSILGTLRPGCAVRTADGPIPGCWALSYGTQQDFVRWFTRPRSGTWMQREDCAMTAACWAPG